MATVQRCLACEREVIGTSEGARLCPECEAFMLGAMATTGAIVIPLVKECALSEIQGKFPDDQLLALGIISEEIRTRFQLDGETPVTEDLRERIKAALLNDILPELPWLIAQAQATPED